MPQTLSPNPEKSPRRPRRTDIPAFSFEPRHAVRCIGEMRFRSQAARDLGCLLDVDADVAEWRCLPDPLIVDGKSFPVDIEVIRSGRTEYLAVWLEAAGSAAPTGAADAAAERGAILRLIAATDLAGDRLENCRELLRYAKWRVSLSDRIRLLAALDQEGSMSLVECMSAVRNATDPIGVVAALALRRFVEIDLDSGPLGPETRVTRFRG